MYKIIGPLSIIVALLLGALFYLHQESWIIFNFPSPITLKNQQNTTIKTQEAALWIWNKETFKQETTEIIYSDNIAQTLKQLLNNWFIFLEEEQIINNQITVQTVALSPSGQEAFICLNQYPFDHQSSTHKKLMIIESMLKTIKGAKLGLTHIRLLVHHQPIQDDHLNFDISWPIQGYLV